MPVLTRFLLGVVIGFSVSLTATLMLPSDGVRADHQFGLGGAPYLRLADLHPTPGQTTTYSLCTNDPVIELNWAYGPETWEDVSRNLVHVNQLSECNSAATTIFQWEFAQVCGSANAAACWFPDLSRSFNHGLLDFHTHIGKAAIIYDMAIYSGASIDQRNFASSHEWGHGMSLLHHPDPDGPCVGVDWLMVASIVASDPVCQLQPNPGEVCSSWEAYLYQPDCDTDSDGDGCTRFEEDGIEPSVGGSRNPNYFWDFFDVTGNKQVDFGDTLDVTSYFGDPGLPGTPGNLRDRAVDGTGWRTLEANDGVDLSDALNAQAQFGHSCTGLPN